MKKITTVLLLALTLNACLLMPPGAPHGHDAEILSSSETGIRLGISCQPHRKYYTISGTADTDSVYISSGKMRNQEHLMFYKQFLCSGTQKTYPLRMGDHKFHHNVTGDTIRVRVVKADKTVENYRFLLRKDHFIKN